MIVDALDHVVVYAEDVEATAAFYADLLDAEELEYGDGFRAVRFGDGRINVRPDGDDATLVADRPRAGGADFCLVASVPMDAVVERLDAADVEVVEGPVEREGARGTMRSVYFRDPDGNLVEIAEYPD